MTIARGTPEILGSKHTLKWKLCNWKNHKRQASEHLSRYMSPFQQCSHQWLHKRQTLSSDICIYLAAGIPAF